MSFARLSTRSRNLALGKSQTLRGLATVSQLPVAARNHRVVVIGGGTAGLNVSHQLLRSGKFSQDEIAVVDPAEWHHYQAGWTLVGGGVKRKEDLRKPLQSLVDPKLKFYNEAVVKLSPDDNCVTIGQGQNLSYEHLVIVPGIVMNYSSIPGFAEALANPDSNVVSTYGYGACDNVFPAIQNLKQGKALFTQPKGVIKCAGGPQKIMWLALDYWKKAGLYKPGNPSDSPISISFATGLPTMFGVPKYSKTLEKLRQERGVEGLFEHDLVTIDGNTATLCQPDGKLVTMKFDLLHAVPKMEPHKFIADSKLANSAGYVDVSEHTTRHKTYENVWSIGDASGLPTSKTTAAIASQAPVLVDNILSTMEGKGQDSVYDGYTSCPLVTEYGKVLLAEFKYQGEPSETFGRFFMDQATPRRAFYYMKKDFFPWVYYSALVKGTWGGPKGWISR